MSIAFRTLLATSLLLPALAVAADGPVHLKHDGPAHGVAFSPDGRFLYTTGDDDIIRAWDVASGREKRNWSGNQGGILALALSADGRTLATAGRDSTVRLWNTATGKETDRLTGHKGNVEGLALSADGRFLAASGSGRSGMFRRPTDDLAMT